MLAELYTLFTFTFLVYKISISPCDLDQCNVAHYKSTLLRFGNLFVVNTFGGPQWRLLSVYTKAPNYSQLHLIEILLIGISGNGLAVKPLAPIQDNGSL